MKKYSLCLMATVVTFSFFLTCSLAVQVSHQVTVDPKERFLSVLDTLLQKYGVTHSPQLQYCFTESQKQFLWPVLVNITTTGLQAGTTELQNLPSYLSQVLNVNISSASISCFYEARDFRLYFSNYNTSIKQVSSTWAQIVGKEYLAIHSYFKSLRGYIEREEDQQYAYTLDSMFTTIFGNRNQTDDEWTKSVKNFKDYTEGKQKYYGISVSNGVIGAVSSMKPLNIETTVLAGAYDVFGRGRVNNIVETFPALQLQIDYGYDITSSRYYNMEQSLHFDTGELKGAFSSDYCSVSYSYLALKNLPFAFYTEIQLAAHRSQQIALKLKHEAPEYLNNIQKAYESIDSHVQFDIVHTTATTKSGQLQLVIASSYILPDGLKHALLHEDWDSNMHFLKLKLNVTKGHIYKIGVITSLISSSHHQDPLNQAIRVIERAVSIGSQGLLRAHKQLWSQLWKNDIIIQGHDEDQKSVRLMLYHCYSFINDWKSYGISPMGLSGLGYNGHVFWDMDLWIYPAVLALKPELAKTLIEYRYERLQAAKDNAFINGYKGAMYPWESSTLGIEQTPVWALTGPLEHHISGCVAFAAWNYFCVSQDRQWLEEKGYPIIKAIADFWVSRVELGDDDYYHIKNVVAADEWAENVNDNAFTNAVAIKSLQIVNRAASFLNLPQNPTYAQVSSKIIILTMDNQVTRQHSTYNGQVIKQADVNLLSFPLKLITDTEQIKRDLKFYQSRIPIEGTPAMTYSIFTILYSRLQDSDNSYKYFKESFRDNLRPPFEAFAETKTGTNPYFMTGAGGVLQSMIFGFGGYDITDNGLVKIETAIPKEWKSVTIKGHLDKYVEALNIEQ